MSGHLDDRAACRDLPAEVFFLEKGDDAGPAKAICATCPVARACLEAALERDEEFGIWGGAGESERRLLAKQRQRGGTGWDTAWRNWWSRLAASVAGERYEVVNRNSENATHGVVTTYARGCRCGPCVFAAAVRTQRSPSRRERSVAS